MTNIRNRPKNHPASDGMVKTEMWFLEQEQDFTLISHGELVLTPT